MVLPDRRAAPKCLINEGNNEQSLEPVLLNSVNNAVILNSIPPLFPTSKMLSVFEMFQVPIIVKWQ